MSEKMDKAGSWRRVIRLAAVWIVNGYVVGLITYLILRLILGDSLWWLGFINNLAPFLFAPLLALLPLALILRARLAALRMLPLVLIGLLWFAPYFWPKSAPPATGATIHVLTFNIWGLNQQLDAVESWIRDLAPDIVLMQEVPPSYAEGGLSALADVYPYQAIQHLENMEWGRAFLSRYPIVEANEFDLEGDGTPTHQRLVLDVEGEQVAVYNIHLLMPLGETVHISLPIDNPFLNMAIKYDDNPRNNQIRALLDLLRDEPLPYIVAGDFNTADQAVIYGELAALMGDSFREAGVGFGWSWPVGVAEEFDTPLPPMFRLDYIWHSDDLRALSAGQGPKLGSDHLPLYATLELR